MARRISGIDFEVVALIDDDPHTREAYVIPVEGLDLSALDERGPLGPIEECVERIGKSAQAVITDYKLTVKTYSNYNGAQLAAYFNAKHTPTLLCTRYGTADVSDIRPFRRHVPVMLSPGELDEDAIETGIEICVGEFKGEFRPARRPWRTQVYVDDVYKPAGQKMEIYLSIPGWKPDVVRVKHNELELPVGFDILQPGSWLYAHTNLGAERMEDLYFFDWSLL